MKMTKKFDKLNETFNVSGEIISTDNTETAIDKIEKMSTIVDRKSVV